MFLRILFIFIFVYHTSFCNGIPFLKAIRTSASGLLFRLKRRESTSETNLNSTLVLNLQSTIEELKLTNAVLCDKLQALRGTVYYYKEKANTFKKERDSVKKMLLSQISELETKHEIEKEQIVLTLRQNHETEIKKMRNELLENFEVEKSSIVEDLESKRLEEVGTIRMELNSEIENSNYEIEKLEKKLKNEKLKSIERLKEVESLKSRQDIMAVELKDLKNALKSAVKNSQKATALASSLSVPKNEKNSTIDGSNNSTEVTKEPVVDKAARVTQQTSTKARRVAVGTSGFAKPVKAGRSGKSTK